MDIQYDTCLIESLPSPSLSPLLSPLLSLSPSPTPALLPKGQKEKQKTKKPEGGAAERFMEGQKREKARQKGEGRTRLEESASGFSQAFVGSGCWGG